MLFVVQTALLGFSAWWHAPTQDEVAHLPAGLAVWRFGLFDLYCVNPPLVRVVAASPVLVLNHKENWTHYVPQSHRRSEWDVGADFVAINGERALQLMTVARWACIPFCWLGLFVCWLWGQSLTGDTGGLIAAALWALSPNILGHGPLITPDVPGVALGLWACWRFRHWLEGQTWRNAFGAGLCLGLALLAKSTWILLLAIWPLQALIKLWCDRSPRRFIRSACQLAILLILGLNVLNLGYGCRGTGRPLEELPFFSRALSGEIRNPDYDAPGNRFQGTWLGKLPVPVPSDFVAGIDLQKRDFELPHWNFLWGQHRQQGWWCYYLVGLGVKVPLSTWLLAVLGGGTFLRCMTFSQIRRELFPLILPALTILLLASSQTGLNHHVRYVFAVLPVLFVLASGCALWKNKWLAPTGICLTAAVSLGNFPHSLSYFNMLAGGPENGHNVLIGSNVDWGQDLLGVRRWLQQNPQAKPVTLAAIGSCPLSAIDLSIPRTPPGKPPAGWHLLSVHLLHDPPGGYADYFKLAPVDRVGFSFNVYHIPAGEVTETPGSPDNSRPLPAP